MSTNVLLCGVGGQGIITASAVLAEAALVSGCDVKKSEVHGMSQRGGSVESHVRFSHNGKVHSPLIPAGGADLLLAFEMLEALRKLAMAGPEAVVLTDEREIVPMSVTSGPFEYPTGALDQLCASGRAVHVVRALELASELGEPRAANTIMLGAASRFLEIERDAWEAAIKACVRPRVVDINLRAFDAGTEALGIG